MDPANAQALNETSGALQPMGVGTQQQLSFPKMPDLTKQHQALPPINNCSRDIANATDRTYDSGFWSTTESSRASVAKLNTIEKMHRHEVDALKHVQEKNQLVSIKQQESYDNVVNLVAQREKEAQDNHLSMVTAKISAWERATIHSLDKKYEDLAEERKEQTERVKDDNRRIVELSNNEVRMKQTQNLDNEANRQCELFKHKNECAKHLAEVDKLIAAKAADRRSVIELKKIEYQSISLNINRKLDHEYRVKEMNHEYRMHKLDLKHERAKMRGPNNHNGDEESGVSDSTSTNSSGEDISESESEN